MNDERKSWLASIAILLIAAAVGWAGSQGGARFAGVPIFVLAVALAFIIQWLVFIPSYLKQSEMVFDLTGGFTYLAVIWLAVLLRGDADGRAWLLLGLISIWAIRLASFLFARIRAAGEDRRFREHKTSLPRFLVTWTLQGLWVTFSLAAALAAITSELRPALGPIAWIGAGIWLLGFGMEVIADQQKRSFRADPANAGKFIHQGLWSWSRHPNYFGEIVLWIGIAVIALPTLQGWGWLMLVSPLFVILLLTRISGIPLLAARAEKKWGDQADYQAYKARTSLLIPRPPRR